jgi:hypothetical protein
MEMASEISFPVFAFGTALTVHMAISFVFLALAGGKTSHGRWLSQIVGGSPMWTWCYGAGYQCLVLPAVVYWDFSSFGGTGSEWLLAQWGEGNGGAMAWFHYIMLSYFVKDLLFPMTTIIFIHHVVCGFMVWLSLNNYLGGGHCAFALGTVLMELGSGANALQWLFPHPKWVPPAFLASMTLSNITSLACSLYWASVSHQSPAFIRGLFVCVAVPVAAIRQKEAHVVYNEKTSSKS